MNYYSKAEGQKGKQESLTQLCGSLPKSGNQRHGDYHSHILIKGKEGSEELRIQRPDINSSVYLKGSEYYGTI